MHFIIKTKIMKKTFLLFTISFLVFSCKKVSKETIVANIKGIPNGRQVILKRQGEKGKIINIDTTTVKDGKFSFAFHPKEPMVVGIFIDSIRQGIFPLIDTKDVIYIEADKDSLLKATIKGSKLNDDLTALRKFRDEHTAKIMSKSAEFGKAQKEKDTVTLNKLNAEARKVQKIIAANEWKYIKTHNDSYVTPMILGSFLRDPMYKDSVKIVFDNLSDRVKNSSLAKGLREYFERQNKKPKVEAPKTSK